MESKETDNPKATEKDPPSVRGEYLTNTLKTVGFGPVLWVNETGSTNTDLLNKSSRVATNGMVVIADFQTLGRGRKDRKWVSEAGVSLLMSVNFLANTESVNLGVFTSGLAIASCEALHSLGFEQVQIKWPNDLVVEEGERQAKLAGVLAQSKIVKNRAFVVVGIGINVHPSNLKDVLSERDVISLSDIKAPPDRVELAESILSILAGLDLQSPNFWQRYYSHSGTIGKVVRISTDKGVLIGVAEGITTSGSLLVSDNEGVTHEVTSGDLVSLRPV